MKKLMRLGWHMLCHFAPKTAVKIQYRHILGTKLDLKNPKDLNEKINYLKFHSNLDEWSRLADKYAVRGYVIEHGLGDILIPLYGKYDSPEELINDWQSLPQKFVIKTNHGCGEVKIVTDKDSINLESLKREVDAWLKERYGRETNEKHYLKIKPCILVEKLLEESGFTVPTDYKFWCFEGNPFCVLVITGRKTDGNKIYYRSMYDLEWNKISDALPHNETYTEIEIKKPRNLDKMIEYARVLSKGHKEVRVDLYNIEGNIYFGELTFTARGGFNNYSKELLLEMGRKFDVK